MQATHAKSGKKPTIQSYHKVSLLFVGASLLLLIFVLYLSVSKAIIDITPKEKAISVEIPASVAVEVDKANEMPGYVFEKTITRARTFTLPQGDAQPVEAKATGTVTITNDSTAPQALIATTRLLYQGGASQEGVLFRLDAPVTVPAGGHVDARVSADLPGQTGEVPAGKFTIPGLNPEKQKLIYATSADAMTGGVRYVRPLRQSDVDGAVEEMKKQLLDEAKTEWSATYDTKGFDGYAADSTVLSTKTDVPLDKETGVFTLTMDVTLRGIAYPLSSLQDIVEAKMLETLDQGERIGRVNYDAAQIALKNVDTNKQVAEIVITLDGTAVIDTTHPTLAPDQFVNKSAADVVAMVKANELVQDVEVRFIPAWLKRMPTLPDHIEVRVRDIEKK